MKGERIYQALGNVDDELLERYEKMRTPKKRRMLWGAAAACLLLVVVGSTVIFAHMPVSQVSNSNSATSVISEQLRAESTTTDIGQTAAAPPIKIASSSSGMMAAISLDGLLNKASEVVTARVVGFSSSFAVAPLNGASPSFFTNVYLEVTHVYRGDLSAHEYIEEGQNVATITVRIEGGSGERVSVTSNTEPTFQMGTEYLLFLYQPKTPYYYNTEGDYYRVVSMNQGAWSETTPGVFVKVSSTESINEPDIATAVATYHQTVSLEFENPLQSSLNDLENLFVQGRIDEATYESLHDKLMSKPLGYARILTAEEQRIWENSFSGSVAIGIS